MMITKNSLNEKKSIGKFIPHVIQDTTTNEVTYLTSNYIKFAPFLLLGVRVSEKALLSHTLPHTHTHTTALVL